MPRREECSFIHFYRENERTNNKLPPEPKRVSAGLPRRILDATMTENCAYLAWLEVSRFPRTSTSTATYSIPQNADYSAGKRDQRDDRDQRRLGSLGSLGSLGTDKQTSRQADKQTRERTAFGKRVRICRFVRLSARRSFLREIREFKVTFPKFPKFSKFPIHAFTGILLYTRKQSMRMRLPRRTMSSSQ